MKFKLLRWPGEIELTIFAGRLQIRFGTHQIAAWWHKGNYEFVTLFDTGRRATKIGDMS